MVYCSKGLDICKYKDSVKDIIIHQKSNSLVTSMLQGNFYITSNFQCKMKYLSLWNFSNKKENDSYLNLKQIIIWIMIKITQ